MACAPRSPRHSFAQTTITCQFCERNTDIEFKCYDCALLLCEPCKINLHSKPMCGQVHRIANIKDIKEEDHKNEKADRYLTIPCDNHQRPFCLFCTSCDSLVCASCLLEKHKNHSLEEISKAFERKKTRLEDTERRINDDLIPEAQSERRLIDDLWLRKQSQYEQKKQDIEAQRKTLVQSLNTYSDKLLGQHNAFMKRMSEAFDVERGKLNAQEQVLLQNSLSIKAAMNSSRPTEIFSLASNIGDKQELMKPSVTTLRSIVGFTEGNFSECDKQRIFGSLLEARLLQSFTTDLLDVGLIAAVNDTLWIANKEMRILRQVKIRDKLQTVRSIEDLEVSDLAVMNSGNLILKISKSNKVQILTHNGKMKLFRDFSPLKPTCVHVLSSGDIAVGIKENGSNFAVSQTSKRQIHVFTSSGKPKHVYDQFVENERLFTYIWNMSSTGSEDICAIDRLSEEFNGRLVMLENGGTLKWIFNGKPDKSFKPRDLLITAAGNVIVSERLTHALSILSAGGSLLVCVALSEMDMFLPQSICINKDGNIWVGCGSGKGESNKAKLHKIRMSFLA